MASQKAVYHKTTLRNGLRVVTERNPSVRSLSLGVWIDVGSRNESPAESGVSHLVEHMAFKGTRRRTARQIALSLESLGGGLNAFTSREQTCYTARVLDDHLDTAVDVLADITCHATLTPTNLKREKSVIIEEIRESLENPSDHIHDVFAGTFWADHPLGRPIMGTAQNLSRMPRAKILDYIKRNYRSGSIVIAASGSVSHDRLVKLARRKFEFATGRAETAPKASHGSGFKLNLVPSENGQTHLCLGYPGLRYASRWRMDIVALNTYLGGGMSSALFQKVREARGMAYSIYSYHEAYRDAGVFGVYLATDKRRVREAFNIVLGEIARVKGRRVSATRLDQIKQQLKGQLMLSMEYTASRMSRLARLELLTGKYIPLEQTMREIDAVTPSRLMEAANRVFDDSRLAVAVLGPATRSDFKSAAGK
ncbi:MAG: insulinase family protein [candidate division Zixibacteria bacterium]|nr:insulinase family protein [candidate division Zixibacteria bacterium]